MQVNFSDSSSLSGISHRRAIRKWMLTFLFSLIFAIPTFIVALIPVQWYVIIPGLTVRDIILFTLSSFVQVRISGLVFTMTFNLSCLGILTLVVITPSIILFTPPSSLPPSLPPSLPFSLLGAISSIFLLTNL